MSSLSIESAMGFRHDAQAGKCTTSMADSEASDHQNKVSKKKKVSERERERERERDRVCYLVSYVAL